MICKQCKKTLDWPDTMADMALKPGNVTQGYCRDCRRVVFSKALKEKEEKAN